ncbi:hypothetical protein VNO77_09123 [Canavalia gladiata]|uniref:Uncharacterized protein n=1 Tax=Canavalia gladiata TaxID=3824 RepID=A0AAN9M9P1_CANGL
MLVKCTHEDLVSLAYHHLLMSLDIFSRSEPVANLCERFRRAFHPGLGPSPEVPYNPFDDHNPGMETITLLKMLPSSKNFSKDVTLQFCVHACMRTPPLHTPAIDMSLVGIWPSIDAETSFDRDVQVQSSSCPPSWMRLDQNCWSKCNAKPYKREFYVEFVCTLSPLIQDFIRILGGYRIDRLDQASGVFDTACGK